MRGVLVAVLLVIGAAAIAAGIVYVTEPAHSLPTFFPGYAAHVIGKHKNRGYAGIGLGVALVVIAIGLALTGGKRGAAHSA